ncbi:uncharacterized protein LOC125369824 [Ricinus communis]|uniref:uncharacterized protein LOC125369824 n=1 Tax=Ricinus communis TaxID=3988 RepID=UPI00201A76E5|nr:uncharacterized protein LOC125369824 [Ricinus communis]
MANPPREVGAERRMTMKDYALPTIGNTTSCIVLGDTSRNYELKSIHFNMLPSFYAGGAMLERTPDEVYNIFEMLGANSLQKSVRTKRIEVNEVVANSEMAIQLTELTKQVNILTSIKNSQNNEVYDICGIYGHSTNVCSSFNNYRGNMYDQTNLMDSYQPMHPMNDPYSNTYNTDQEQTLRSNEQMKPSLEETLQSFMMASHDRMERNEKKTDSIETSLKRLKAQMEQIVEELNKEELSNQLEQANCITTIRRCEVVDNIAMETETNFSSYAGTPKNDGLVQSNEESIQKEEKVEPNLRLEKKEKEAFSGPEFHKAAQPYRPPIPFVNQPKESKNDEFFFESIEMLSKVNTNLPLLDVIRNKPAYAKFFEELNTNKRRYANNEKVQVASVMLQHQLPLKMKDPGSFTINITIGAKKDTKVMLDLGASINLMTYLMYELLGLGELKATTMYLQFADISIKYPRGIVEDLLVQVGKLIIPVDFVVLDMENTPTRDKEQTILLGRHFMATTRTVIDVHDGKLTMTVLGETVELKNFHDTLDVRINSMKPYLKGMAYDEKVECADERSP